MVLAFAGSIAGLAVAMRDDGSGFAVPPDLRSRDGHWGSLGMRERASQIGAKLSVHSAADVGTTITLVLPSPRSIEMENSSLKRNHDVDSIAALT